MTHNEKNTSCPQNRCGEWAKCNNYECEGEHECTCETPTVSWEELLEKLLHGLDEIVFVKSTDSVSGEVENLQPKILDMEAVVHISGEWDREDFKKVLGSIYDEAYRKGVRAGQLEAVAAYQKAVLGHAGEVTGIKSSDANDGRTS